MAARATGPLRRLWPALDNYYRLRNRVTAREGVAYAGDSDDPKHRLDLYLPGEVRETRTPLAVFVHGGYWKAQDRRLLRPLLGLYSNVGVALAARGIGVAIVGHRQHPRARSGEDSLQDVARGVAWVQAHASEFGGDARRVALIGHSAGGHLAALLGLEPARLAAVGAAPVRGVAAIAGLYDLRAALPELKPAHATVLRGLFGEDDAALARSSPALQVHAGAPPFLLLAAGDDAPWLQAQQQAMQAALQAAGTPVRGLTLPGRGHMSIVIEMGRANDAVTGEVARFIVDATR